MLEIFFHNYKYQYVKGKYSKFCMETGINVHVWRFVKIICEENENCRVFKLKTHLVSMSKTEGSATFKGNAVYNSLLR